MTCLLSRDQGHPYIIALCFPLHTFSMRELINPHLYSDSSHQCLLLRSSYDISRWMPHGQENYTPSENYNLPPYFLLFFSSLPWCKAAASILCGILDITHIKTRLTLSKIQIYHITHQGKNPSMIPFYFDTYSRLFRIPGSPSTTNCMP